MIFYDMADYGFKTFPVIKEYPDGVIILSIHHDDRYSCFGRAAYDVFRYQMTLDLLIHKYHSVNLIIGNVFKYGGFRRNRFTVPVQIRIKRINPHDTVNTRQILIKCFYKSVRKGIEYPRCTQSHDLFCADHQ